VIRALVDNDSLKHGGRMIGCVVRGILGLGGFFWGLLVRIGYVSAGDVWWFIYFWVCCDIG
jgi:hypothetical protein